MEVREILPGDTDALSKFYQLASQVYAKDPAWVPQSESALQSLLSASDRLFVQPLVCVQTGVPLARAVAILHPGAVNNQGQPVGYIGSFECLEQCSQAGQTILEYGERLLRARGAVTVQVPRMDNMVMGLVIDRFDLPQTVLTTHNPRYYADILMSSGYEICERLQTFLFDRRSAISLSLSRPGFRTRTFNRRHLDDEVTLFHTVQQAIFNRHPGWVARTQEEDRLMIDSFLPILDDDLVIIAEEESGRPVGLLVCVPDIYQAYRGQAVDNARLISIGVIEPFVHKGLGVLMCLHLARNLIAKGYQTMEASWIRGSNILPKNLAARFLGRPGREFALFEKRV